MKLRIILCVNTPDGMGYLATDGCIYYVKGIHCSTPERHITLDNAMASYIGTLNHVIDRYGKGCKAPNMYGTEVTL